MCIRDRNTSEGKLTRTKILPLDIGIIMYHEDVQASRVTVHNYKRGAVIDPALEQFCETFAIEANQNNLVYGDGSWLAADAGGLGSDASPGVTLFNRRLGVQAKDALIRVICPVSDNVCLVGSKPSIEHPWGSILQYSCTSKALKVTRVCSIKAHPLTEVKKLGGGMVLVSNQRTLNILKRMSKKVVKRLKSSVAYSLLCVSEHGVLVFFNRRSGSASVVIVDIVSPFDEYAREEHYWRKGFKLATFVKRSNTILRFAADHAILWDFEKRDQQKVKLDIQ
eukprot:TRINITY_DN4981_c0_g1_i2.p2 TRINITY_DN4981_c0_g1~~TRINITY_DN4981_c0_g1_i2.p2  ORF type:complete len:280 (+),score=16.40 TRINITY_DN4981_c0_g1_i2:64-903(+)